MSRCIRAGAVPPACEKIHWMSGKRCAVPLNRMLVMVRAVSVPSSITGSGTPGMMLTQQSLRNGWV